MDFFLSYIRHPFVAVGLYRMHLFIFNLDRNARIKFILYF
jgi:hypothetical protein